MSQVCENCNEVAYKLRFMPTLKKSLGYGPGTCHCAEKHLCQTSAIPRETGSKFKIRFDHVNDEFGRNLEVNNIRELERAESRLGFQSVVLNKDAQNFDDAPQQPVMDMARVHNWKFSSEQRYRQSQGRR
jgi:hypothetical protein